MFRIYTGGSCTVSNTSPYHKLSYPMSQTNVEPQYDHMEFSAHLDDTQRKLKETVGRLSQEIRTHVSSRDLEQLKQQISNGQYQPYPREIASRMLLMRGDD